MRAISLTQALATLVVLGEKEIETRGWKPSAKMWQEISGQRIAVHAAQKFPAKAKLFARTNSFAVEVLNRHGFESEDQLPLGAIIGTVEIVEFQKTEDVRLRTDVSEKELSFGIYDDGRWAWFLKDPRMYEKPIPCKGALSLWSVPGEIENLIKEAKWIKNS